MEGRGPDEGQEDGTGEMSSSTLSSLSLFLFQMQVDGGMRLQNQIIHSLTKQKNKKGNLEMKLKVKPSDFGIYQTSKDFIKINEDDIIKIHVTNDNKPLSKIKDTSLINELNQKEIVPETPKTVSTEPVPEPVQKPSISSSTLLEVVQTKQGTWDRDLYILNPDLELTDTIKETFEAHRCRVQVSGLERDLVYLYVLLDKKVSQTREASDNFPLLG